MPDPFAFSCDALGADLHVLGFHGTEAVSDLYDWDVLLLAEGGDVAGEEGAMGARARLTLARDDGRDTVIHGILASLELAGTTGDGAAVYRAALVPRVWKLTQSRHSRVFVDETVPGIVQTVLHDAGLTPADYDLRLADSYAPLDHVCQYKESHWSFVARWMEREGLYYFFEQGEDQEKLLITDSRSFQEKLGDGVARFFAGASGDAAPAAALRSFRRVRRVRPSRVAVSDYDYLRPSLPLTGEGDVDAVAGGTLRLHDEHARSPEHAKRLSKVRTEEIKARATTYLGEGALHDVRSGYVLKLEEHPLASLNASYLVTAAEHVGSAFGSDQAALRGLVEWAEEATDVYRVKLAAIPESVQFRPEQRAPAPRVDGVETAIVDGPTESQYAQLDEHGRYLVRFLFDEGARPGQASTRVRMMQPHGGNPEGFHFPLRKGTEVLVVFLGGDPDRPVIAGVAPNAHRPSVVTDANKTKNVIRTGGGNRIVMEDTDGKQYIHIATPHKKSFIHIGSPFNPQYHKITFTSGTSLSYTDDISTSVTQTDSQTIVGDSRITVIGRSRMTPDDLDGTEITNLLSRPFIANDGNATDKAIALVFKGTPQATSGIKGDASAVYKAWDPTKASPTNATPVDTGAIATLVMATTGQASTALALDPNNLPLSPSRAASDVTKAVTSAISALQIATASPSKTTFTALNKAIQSLQGAAASGSTLPTGMYELQAANVQAMSDALDAAVTKVDAMNTDATALLAASVGPPAPSPAPTSFDPATANAWAPLVTVAATAIHGAQTFASTGGPSGVSVVSEVSALPLPPTMLATVDPNNPDPTAAAFTTVKNQLAAVKQAAADVTTLVNEIGYAASLARSAVAGAPVAPVAGPPILPNPNAAPEYLNLPHVDATNTLQLIPDDSTNTAIDKAGTLPTGGNANPKGVTPETADPTALDILDTVAYPTSNYPPGFQPPNPMPASAEFRSPDTPWPLHPGSDVKIVGGDNVTLAANDARSHTQGHSYGLVQGGQTSVVYSPEKYDGALAWASGRTQALQATVAQDQAQVAQLQAALGVPPQRMIGGGRGGHPVPNPNYQQELHEYQQREAALNAAQQALTTAQNQLAPLLDGKPSRPTPLSQGWDPKTIAQVSTVYGDVRSWLDGDTDVTITGHRWTTIDQGATTTVTQRAGDAWAQETTINGNQSSTVNGHVHSYITGGQDSTIHGGQTVTVFGAKTATTLGVQTGTVVGAQFGFCIGPHVTVDLLKIAGTLIGISSTISSINHFAMRATFGLVSTENIVCKFKNHEMSYGNQILNLLTAGLHSYL